MALSDTYMTSIQNHVFDQFPYAHLVLRVNPGDELTLALCNPAAAILYGISSTGGAGKQLHHVFTGTIADFLEKNGKTCAQKQQVIITDPQSLHEITDGTQSFTFTPIFDTHGENITHISVTALPYEASKLELQKERDHALMLMSAAFDASSLGIFVTGRDKRIVRVNDAFLRDFHFRRRDLIGKDCTQIYVPADRRSVNKAYKHFLRTQNPIRHEWRIRNGHGDEMDVLVTTAPLHLHPDRPLVVHTLVDISDHKHLEESLRWAKEQADSANRAKSAFLASMSHELRTPLNAILGFSELMLGETFGALGHDKYREYMDDIHFAAEHLLEIINDVLDMSKIEAGKFELMEQNIEPDSLFQSVIRVMTDRAEENGLTIETDIDTRIHAFFADRRVLRQMLFNLLSNAIKFSFADQTIHVSARIDDDTGNGVIAVTDHGRGINPEDLKRVVEPFSQGQAHISDGSGTGLGLPLTKAMSELHGGSFRIISEPNKGTTASIILPESRVITKASAQAAKR